MMSMLSRSRHGIVRRPNNGNGSVNFNTNGSTEYFGRQLTPAANFKRYANWRTRQMGILAKLFGGPQPVETKKAIQCNLCGKILHGGSGGIVSGPRQQMSNYMLSKAQYCSSCEKAFCLDCCLLSAAKKGKTSIWECPICGLEFPKL